MKKKKLFVFLLSVALLLVLCGCGGDAPFTPREEHDTLVIIAGHHANSRKCTEDMLDAIDFDELVDSTMTYTQQGDRYSAQAHVYVISCDGKPSVVEITNNGKEVNLSASSKYVENLMDDIYNVSDRIVKFLMSDELKADDPECDLVGALTLARNVLRMHPGEKNHILILDSGITSAGNLNMAEVAIQSDTADVVLSNSFSEAAFPDLDGYFVTFLGLGNADGLDQDDMANDSTFQTQLEEFWTAYFTICRATLTRDIVYTYGQGEVMQHNSDNPDSYPFVTPVIFQRAPVPVPQPKPDDGTEEPLELPDPPKYSENRLAFKGGRAEFRDDVTDGKTGKEIAIAALKNDQSYFDAVLAYDPDAVFYVVGSIAQIDPDRFEEQGTTSQERADAVSGILNQHCGIDQSKIISIGAGLTPFSWRTGVEFPDGTKASMSESGMAANRIVIIIPSIETEMVRELKENLTAAGLTAQAGLVRAE